MRMIKTSLLRPATRAVVLFFAAILFLTSAHSQQTKPGATKGDSFTTLLNKLQSGDTSIDFKLLRTASLNSRSEAAGEADLPSRQKTMAAFKAGKHNEVVVAGEQVLRTAYLDLETHLLVANAYKQTGNTSKFQFHQAVFLGLIQSILTGGDGRSAKTAYVVIGPYEEYAVMRALELSIPKQSFQRVVAGRSYDVLTGTDMKTNQSREVWFSRFAPVGP